MKMGKKIDVEQKEKKKERNLNIDPRKTVRQYHSFI